MSINELTGHIIGASMEVHRRLGPGPLESAYEECLCYELSRIGIPHTRQVPVPIIYRYQRLDVGYRLDILVSEEVIVEIKAIEKLLPIHEAQLLTYLRLTGRQAGLLINFNVPVLRDGIKRVVNNLIE